MRFGDRKGGVAIGVDLKYTVYSQPQPALGMSQSF
jgi:hypothetical protein